MKVMLVTVMSVVPLFLWSCKSGPLTPPSPSADDFPLSVGSTWTYVIYDSVSRTSDTVIVVVDREVSASGGNLKYLWLYRYATRTDSIYVIQSNDTVTYGPFGTPMFIVPLQVGKGWKIDQWDTLFVIAQETVVVPSGNYYQVFHVEETSWLPNAYSRHDYWVKPGVGIIRMINNALITVEPQGLPKKESWQLLSFSIWP